MKAYEACHEPFLRYCSALAYGKMDVQDLVQDVLVSAYHRFEKIANKDQLLHYLVRAARNRSISIWRKQKHQESLSELHAERLPFHFAIQFQISICLANHHLDSSVWQLPFDPNDVCFQRH